MNLKRVVTMRHVLDSHIDFIIHIHAMLRESNRKKEEEKEKTHFDDDQNMHFERQHDLCARL